MPRTRPDEPRTWRVGDLADEAGVSVRTLHYYEEIELLVPSRRTAAGHRLYTEPDVIRLQQIVALRQLGFSLDDIRAFLRSPGATPRRVVEMHVAHVGEQIRQLEHIRARLARVAEQLAADEPVSVEAFLQLTKEMIMLEKYYTQEQLEQLEARRQQVGEDRIRQVQEEWTQVFAGLRAAMDSGADPASESVQDIARRARGLIAEFTGGDAGIERSLTSMWKGEPGLRQQHGLDPALADYMGKAMAALK